MAKTRWARDYTRDIIDAKQRFDDVREHIKEPPDGQIPLNDWGIYASPNLQSNEPVSPFDCEQYPDSPYCGGMPWSMTPVGLEPEWGVDECGAWVQVTPILGFTKLPPVSVGWRKPGKCREEEKPIQQPKPISDLPEEWKDIQPDTIPGGFRPDDIVLAATTTTIYHLEINVINGKRLTNLSFYQGSIDSIIEPTIEIAPSPPSTIYYPPATALCSGTVSWKEAAVSLDLANYRNGTNTPPREQVFYRKFAIHPMSPIQGKNGGHRGANWYVTGEDNIAIIYYGKFGSIFPSNSLYFLAGVSEDGTRANLHKVNLAYLKKISGSPDHYPPPPDQKKKKKCCMQCCSGGNQQSNKQAQDNAEILRLLRKIDKKMGDYPFKVVLFDADDNKVGAQKKTVSVASVAQGQKLIVEREEKNAKSIGIDHFPIYVPSSIVEDESNGILGDIGDLKNKIFKQRIESLAELQLWKTKNDYEIFGRWQEVIEIQDSDPNIKGNQPKRVVLPNMAKSFKEIILLLTVLIRSQGFSLDAILKMYVDLAGVKTSTTATEAITRDIQDYLDYPTVTKTLSVPLGIKIPSEKTPVEDREDIEEFLQNSTVKVVFDDWTGEGSIHDMLLVLLDAAARQIQKPHT